ncbi:JHY protein, partial [Rhynochetos jubatus]|nr:JHY protein [Rhynochetos jubatus]
HDSQESDLESLVQERQYQLELQHRIRENEELVGLYSEELENDSLEEDSSEETSLKEQDGAECGTNRYTSGIQHNDGGSKQQSVDKYFNLRYNPNWKNTKEAAKFSEAAKAREVAGGSSVDFSQDSFYLHSNGFPEEKNQQEATSQHSFSAFGTELLSFHEPNAMVNSEPFRLHTKGKTSADARHFKDHHSTHSSAFSLQIQDNQPQRAKKDFVEKNKRTLGLQSEKINSYLQLHSKNQQVLQEQFTDPKTVDKEPVQSVLPFQTAKMEPEEKWYLKAQKLKDCQNKSHQRNKVKPNQTLQGKALPRNESQRPPRRPTEPKSRHHRHHQIPECQTVPMQAVEQDNSRALEKRLYASPSVGPDTSTANSDTCFNDFPNSRHFENKKYQRDSPNGLPRDLQHLYNNVTAQLFARDNSTNGQAHPNQRNISSTFNANFQELVKDEASFQDCTGHVHVDKRYHNDAIRTLCCIQMKILSFSPLSFLRPSQSPVHSSSKARCTTSQMIYTFTQMMEQQHQEITHLKEAVLLDRHLLSQLTAIIPHVETGSKVDPETHKRNEVKISRSNSEGYFMQLEKQSQPKISKKVRKQISKAYLNLNVKLGGLGPDYEAIKEMKEKLKQQKEYAQQIKEHNRKNIASLQRLPVKPQVTSSSSRQRALEYAKKIPGPKTFMARQSDKEVEETRVQPQTLNGNSLPQIACLETLQKRHEKEKELIAAFRTLHIS